MYVLQKMNRRKAALVGGGLALVLAVGIFGVSHLEAPLAPEPPPEAALSNGAAAEPSVEAPRPPLPEIVLRHRETLDGALLRGGVGSQDASAIIKALRGHVDMRRIHPGERVQVTMGVDDRAGQVAYWRSATERYEINRDGEGWTARAVTTSVDVQVAAVTGQLEDSLFTSMERLGESAALTLKFVNLFEWDFDFAAHALPGDRFRLLVEKRYADNEFIGYGTVLIAQYRTRGRSVLTGVGFKNAEGQTEFFDADGRSVRKMFLRAPLDFTRITSGYSHARFHPILGGLRPHLAIDYGAPIGTPVRAVADGVIESAGWNGGYGLSIMVRHARGYKTMYNHLSKLDVRAGHQVRQRDVIGRVGSTGLSTAPHLDYRVVKNGAFVNPLGEKFIPGSPVPPDRRKAFQNHLDALLERLDQEAPLASASRAEVTTARK